MDALGELTLSQAPGGTELSCNPYRGLVWPVAKLHLSCSSMSSSHALPQPHRVQLDALKRDASWAKSQAPSQAPDSNFPEVHSGSGRGLGTGQSGSSALPGLHNILIIHWECLILARFVHQLFPASNAEGFTGSCTQGGGP